MRKSFTGVSFWENKKRTFSFIDVWYVLLYHGVKKTSEYTDFIIQYLKPKHVITRIFHVFLHENSVKVINSLYTFFDVITFCNYRYKQNSVKLLSKGIESRENFRVKTCFVCRDWIMKRKYWGWKSLDYCNWWLKKKKPSNWLPHSHRKLWN